MMNTHFNFILRTIKRIAVVLIILSGTASSLKAQTLKERIDQVKEIKVYFRNADIISKCDFEVRIASSVSQSGCEKFKEKTPLTAEYAEALKQVIDILNKGFNTNAFVEGNFAAINDLPLNSEGELNWLKLGETLTVFFSTSGAYYTKRQPNQFNKENSLEIDSYIYFFAVDNGKLKTLLSKFLFTVKSPIVKTDKCVDYAFFLKNFPLSSFAEPFKTKLVAGTTDIIEKEMAKYDKAMKKKK
jgi:hypothetical protein